MQRVELQYALAMFLRVSVLLPVVALSLAACGSDSAKAPTDAATAASTGASKTPAPPAKKKATTPAEIARQTRLCNELFSRDLTSPPGTHAMDLIYDYLQSDPNNPTFDVKTVRKVGEDLREVSARAPEWLAPHVAEMADNLDQLRKMAAEDKTAADLDTTSFADLVAGGKATLAICLPPKS